MRGSWAAKTDKKNENRQNELHLCALCALCALCGKNEYTRCALRLRHHGRAEDKVEQFDGGFEFFHGRR